jgi:hypothetical protein
MAIDRTNYNALVDDDGSNTVGTLWTKNQVKIVLLDPIDVAIAAGVSGSASVTTDFTTTSSTAVDVTGASVTLTTTGGPLLVTYSGPMKQAANFGFLLLNVDGVNGIFRGVCKSATEVTVAFVARLTAAAGSHTVKLRALSGDGVSLLTIGGASIMNGVLTVIELKA